MQANWREPREKREKGSAIRCRSSALSDREVGLAKKKALERKKGRGKGVERGGQCNHFNVRPLGTIVAMKGGKRKGPKKKERGRMFFDSQRVQLCLTSDPQSAATVERRKEKETKGEKKRGGKRGGEGRRGKHGILLGFVCCSLKKRIATDVRGQTREKKRKGRPRKGGREKGRRKGGG